MNFGYELASGIATITLDRPNRLNALTFEIYQELADTFERLDREPDVRAIVITGRGRGFCSGGDQDDIIKQLLGKDTPALLAFTRATGRLIEAMRACRRPIVGAINGIAVGAGAVIACACDFRIASATAKFGFIFPKVGLCGADMGITYLLPRIVGLGHASELLFFGDVIDAEHAARIGLVNRVVAPGTEREHAIKLARQMAGRVSEDTIIDGEPHVVVWKDGRPIQAFPPVADLAERPELIGFDERLAQEPPPLRAPRRIPGWPG